MVVVEVNVLRSQTMFSSSCHDNERGVELKTMRLTAPCKENPEWLQYVKDRVRSEQIRWLSNMHSLYRIPSHVLISKGLKKRRLLNRRQTREQCARDVEYVGQSHRPQVQIRNCNIALIVCSKWLFCTNHQPYAAIPFPNLVAKLHSRGIKHWLQQHIKLIKWSLGRFCFMFHCWAWMLSERSSRLKTSYTVNQTARLQHTEKTAIRQILPVAVHKTLQIH